MYYPLNNFFNQHGWEGEWYVVREWKKAEIAGVVKDGSVLSPKDPFEEIDSWMSFHY